MTDENTASEELQNETGELDQGATDANQAEDTPGDTPNPEDGDDSTAQPKKGVGKRIDELTHNWRSAERERDYWREMAMRQQAPTTKTPEQQQQVAEDPGPAPLPMNFDNDEAYQKAMADWVDQRTNHQLAQKEQQAEETRRNQERTETARTWEQRQSKFAASKDDYFAVAHRDDLPVNEAMRDALVTSEKGPEVLYWLGQNAEEAHRIAQLPAFAAAREIGRIEAQLNAAPPKKTTNAPPPVNALSGQGSGAVTDPDNMTTDEWMKQRNAQLES